MADLTLTGDEVRAIVRSQRGSSNAPQAYDYVTATVAYLNRRASPANSQEGNCKCRRLGAWNGEHHPLCDAAQPSASTVAPQGDVVGAECERCGLPPEMHTIAHGCDNQSYRLSASPAALTDERAIRLRIIEYFIDHGLPQVGVDHGRALAELLAASPADQVVEARPALPLVVLDALRFYASGGHFALADDTAWDTVSGEPQNFWCDEAGTATVEDGSIAKAVLQGKAFAFEEPEPAIEGEVFTAAPSAMSVSKEDQSNA